MLRALSLAGLVLCLFTLSIAAQATLPGDAVDGRLLLKYSAFDPLAGEPVIPAALRGGPDTNLYLVQFQGKPTDSLRLAVVEAGGELIWYQPHNAYVVRMAGPVAATVKGLAGVRWVGFYHPAYRLEPFLLQQFLEGYNSLPRKYNLVVADRSQDKPALIKAIGAIGGAVTHEQPGSILLEARLSGAQVLAVSRFDQVLWTDRWTAPENDMNNARIQGGGNAIETAGGYTGKGVNGHLYEGCEYNHPDFTIPATNVLSGGGADTHGHCTAGIIFGNGKSHANARGMAPDAKPYFTQYGSVTTGYSRYQVIQELVTKHDVMFTTASWGGGRTRAYTSTSASTDTIIFDHDIPWTQSQSNAHNQDSRPEAWAKNIFSIGGVKHYDNALRSDDSWLTGGGSTGPAADGRIKPDLCAYYDSIMCSDRSGSAGYSSGNYTLGFGGTSGATPICAGHNALALNMFTDHIFNNTPKVPNGTRFQNRPHFTTLKALQIANARQYAFTASSNDNRREHVGWGFPDLNTMYQNRSRMFLVDETDVLTQGNKKAYTIKVNGNEPELKIAMCFADPAGNPSASITRINDLSLKVTAPDKTIYWGNNGLKLGNYSVAGGSANTIDTVECVFVNQPQAGNWTVEVIATLVAADSHKETKAVDADFGLCVSFGTLTQMGSITHYGKGCQGTGKAPTYCYGINPSGGTLVKNLRSYIYAYPATIAKAVQVSGFRIWTAANSGSPTVATYLYMASGGRPAATATATSSMVIGTTEKFYETTFNPPVSIPANTPFFIAVFHNNVSYVCSLNAGTRASCYYYRSNVWGGPSSIAVRPSFQVLEAGAVGKNAVPLMEVKGSATVGTSLTTNLTMAKPKTSAVLFMGLSDKLWGQVPLPAELTFMGAPGCYMLSSASLWFTNNTGTGGGLTMQLAVPNEASMVGADLYQQFMVLDPTANALGVAFTRAAKIHLGN